MEPTFSDTFTFSDSLSEKLTNSVFESDFPEVQDPEIQDIYSKSEINNKFLREDTIVFGDKHVDLVIKDIILKQTKMKHSDEYLKSMIDEIKESIKNVCNKTVNEEYDYFVRTEFPNYNRNLEDQDIIISNKINNLVNERNIHTSILAKMLKVEESTIKHYLNYNKPVCSSLSGEVISEEQLVNDRNTLLSYI